MNCGTSRKGYPILQALQAETCGFSTMKRKRTCISASPEWSIADSNRCPNTASRPFTVTTSLYIRRKRRNCKGLREVRFSFLYIKIGCFSSCVVVSKLVRFTLKKKYCYQGGSWLKQKCTRLSKESFPLQPYCSGLYCRIAFSIILHICLRTSTGPTISAFSPRPKIQAKNCGLTAIGSVTVK